MQGTHDVDQTTTADDGDGLDPREAARLLAQTEREARRQFNLSPLWINAVMGAVILVAYGSLWLSTRGQHPYKGPSLGVVALVYVGGGRRDRRVREGLPARDRRRQRTGGEAAAGRGGRDPRVVRTRQPRASGRAQALRRQRCDRLRGDPGRGAADHRRHDRPGDRRQQGRLAAVRGRARGRHGGVVAAFVGPSGAWLAAGIGLFVAVVGYAAADASRHRRVGA